MSTEDRCGSSGEKTLQAGENGPLFSSQGCTGYIQKQCKHLSDRDGPFSNRTSPNHSYYHNWKELDKGYLSDSACYQGYNNNIRNPVGFNRYSGGAGNTGSPVCEQNRERCRDNYLGVVKELKLKQQQHQDQQKQRLASFKDSSSQLRKEVNKSCFQGNSGDIKNELKAKSQGSGGVWVKSQQPDSISKQYICDNVVTGSIPQGDYTSQKTHWAVTRNNDDDVFPRSKSCDIKETVNSLHSNNGSDVNPLKDQTVSKSPVVGRARGKSFNNEGDSSSGEDQFSPSSEFQEGLKSILYWHLIGSYQNLNKLSDEDCGDFLIGLRDQASLDGGSIKLNKNSPTSPKDTVFCNNNNGDSQRRPKSLVSPSSKLAHPPTQLGLVTFCMCGPDRNKAESQSPEGLVDNAKASRCQEAEPLPSDNTRNKVCDKCGKYLQNRYLSIGGTTSDINNSSHVKQSTDCDRSSFNWDQVLSNMKQENPNETDSSNDNSDNNNQPVTVSNNNENRVIVSPSGILDNHMIAATILNAKPDILSNPHFQKLDVALDCLRSDSLDGESKLEKLLELDTALDYLVDMVTEKVKSPTGATSPIDSSSKGKGRDSKCLQIVLCNCNLCTLSGVV